MSTAFLGVDVTTSGSSDARLPHRASVPEAAPATERSALSISVAAATAEYPYGFPFNPDLFQPAIDEGGEGG